MENSQKESIEKENVKMETTKTEENASILIAKGNLYGSGKEGLVGQNRIINNQLDWDNLLAQINTVNNVSDSFTETAIDFSKYIVIAVFDELKVSGGHSLEFEITSNSEQMIVNVTRIAPKGMATSVMTQPYYMVKIPKNDLLILFR